MKATEKRVQRKARVSYGCDICGKAIWENCEYMAVTCQKDQGPRVRYKRHIHCDALIRMYAERNGVEPEEVKIRDMRAWLNSICRTECMPGFEEQCRNDRFSCGQIVWLLLRHKPGFNAVLKSTEETRREED